MVNVDAARLADRSAPKASIARIMVSSAIPKRPARELIEMRYCSPQARARDGAASKSALFVRKIGLSSDTPSAPRVFLDRSSPHGQTRAAGRPSQ